MVTVSPLTIQVRSYILKIVAETNEFNIRWVDMKIAP